MHPSDYIQSCDLRTLQAATSFVASAAAAKKKKKVATFNTMPEPDALPREAQALHANRLAKYSAGHATLMSSMKLLSGAPGTPTAARSGPSRRPADSDDEDDKFGDDKAGVGCRARDKAAPASAEDDLLRRRMLGAKYKGRNDKSDIKKLYSLDDDDDDDEEVGRGALGRRKKKRVRTDEEEQPEEQPHQQPEQQDDEQVEPQAEQQKSETQPEPGPVQDKVVAASQPDTTGKKKKKKKQKTG